MLATSLNPARASLWSAALLSAASAIPSCSRRPEAIEPTVSLAAPAASAGVVASATPRVARSFTVALETTGFVSFWPIQGALVLAVKPSSPPERSLFALAEAEGLRRLPALDRTAAADEGDPTLHGIWPGSLWLDVSMLKPAFIERMFRYDHGAWVKAVELPPGDQILRAWPARSGCLMGVTLPSAESGGVATLRPLDCPGGPRPAVALAQASVPRDIPVVEAGPRGDLFLYRCAENVANRCWVEILAPGSSPPGRKASLPDPGRPRQIGLHGSIVVSSSCAFVEALVREESTPGPEHTRPMVHVFNGKEWTLERLPAHGLTLTATEDCTLIGVEAPEGKDGEAVILWTRGASGRWERSEGSVEGPRGTRDCQPSAVHLRAPDDLWVLYGCGHAGWRLLHSGPTREVWRPE